ncbi:Glycoside hydrolase 18 protein [Xylographa soralifera]|nr:Glycoside hydrolase 18 protein [Xylographa soralifera]
MDPQIEVFNQAFSSTFLNGIESKLVQHEAGVVYDQHWQLINDSNGPLRYGEVIKSQRRYCISKECEWNGESWVTKVGKLPLIKAPDIGHELGKLFKAQSARGLVPTARNTHNVCQRNWNGITLEDIVMAVEIWKGLGLKPLPTSVPEGSSRVAASSSKRRTPTASARSTSEEVIPTTSKADTSKEVSSASSATSTTGVDRSITPADSASKEAGPSTLRSTTPFIPTIRVKPKPKARLLLKVATSSKEDGTSSGYSMVPIDSSSRMEEALAQRGTKRGLEEVPQRPAFTRQMTATHEEDSQRAASSKEGSVRHRKNVHESGTKRTKVDAESEAPKAALTREVKWLHEHKGGRYSNISEDIRRGDAERAAGIASFHLVGRYLEEEERYKRRKVAQAKTTEEGSVEDEEDDA